MILIDTSIWIEFFKQNPNYVNEIVLLLESRMVVTIEPIFSELIYGCKNAKEKNKIEMYWKTLPKITFQEGSIMAAAIFANENNFHNYGIGLIDANLIKATIDNNLKFGLSIKK
jgi:predicted nucleic acid-binding protein